MLGSFVTGTLGTLSQLLPVVPGPQLTLLASAVAITALAAFAFARRAAEQVPASAPVMVTPAGHRHHYHRIAPYVRMKDRTCPGTPLPRAPGC